MSENVEKFKKQLGLTRLESDFYDFVCEILGLQDTNLIEYLALQLRPWFSTGSVDGGPNNEVFSQYYSEFIQQKYRIALEFCAKQAGYDHIVGYEDLDNEPVLVSYGHFWFKGSHPNSVHWILTREDEVICRGKVWPNSLNKDNLEEWLLDHISMFSRIKRESENDGDTGDIKESTNLAPDSR